MKAAVLLGVLLFCLIPLHGEDWTTVDGTIYKNVTVLSHDDGYVTIMDEDGGARVMLTELPRALRQRFGFDAAKAMKCVADTEAADQKDREALTAEINQQDAAAARPPVTSAAPAAPPLSGVSAPIQPAATAESDQIAKAKKQDIRDQIESLQNDIAMMQREEAKVTYRGTTGSGILHADGGVVSHGEYSSMITDDQQQVRDLKAQLGQ